MAKNLSIQSITSGPRQSNFEIARLVAMFMVLMVHANFMSLGSPTPSDISQNFFPSFIRISLEELSLYGVNVFIMISGWFTIKTTVRGLSALLFQVFYFGIGILAVLSLLGIEQLSFGRLYQILLLHKSGWFVESYVILYLLAPVINKFCEYASEKDLRNVVISYLIFLMIYGWIDWSGQIGRGYSALSFIGIYLLARYARNYMKISYGFKLFLGCWILNSIITVIILYFKLPIIINSYDNPFIIIGALGLIFYFGNLKVATSKVINYIAKSTFAVYLFHIYPEIMDRFMIICKNLYLENSGIICLIKMTVFLLIVYIASIIFDAPRRLLWNGILKLFSGSPKAI